MKNTVLICFCSLLLFSACKQNSSPSINTLNLNNTVLNLFGEELSTPVESQELIAKKRAKLIKAKADLDSMETKENYIWYGRRLAYLYRYHDAIDVYSEALSKYPDDPEILRHRGHRYISIRDFDSAVSDLSLASQKAIKLPIQLEPDGIPNKLNKPLGNLQFNIWYHLGLAFYLKGDFIQAADIYEQCLSYCDNDDLKVAVVDWLYMTYRRMGEPQIATLLLKKIDDDVVLIENEDYLKRILMYKGKFSADDMTSLIKSSKNQGLVLSTLAYGLANWYLYNDQEEIAKSLLSQIKEEGYWPAFGYIAAEADLERI